MGRSILQIKKYTISTKTGGTGLAIYNVVNTVLQIQNAKIKFLDKRRERKWKM